SVQREVTRDTVRLELQANGKLHSVCPTTESDGQVSNKIRIYSIVGRCIQPCQLSVVGLNVIEARYRGQYVHKLPLVGENFVGSDQIYIGKFASLDRVKLPADCVLKKFFIAH